MIGPQKGAGKWAYEGISEIPPPISQHSIFRHFSINDTDNGIYLRANLGAFVGGATIESQKYRLRGFFMNKDLVI